MNLEQQLARLQEIWATLQKTPRIQLYNVARAHFGKDVTPNDRIPDDVACAETLSTLLNKVRPTPIITGTHSLYVYLRTRYQVVQVPLPGDVIIAPTGMARHGTPIKNGHVGIVMKDNVIYSNNSLTGLLDDHFTIDTWNKRYRDKGGYPVYYFRIV